MREPIVRTGRVPSLVCEFSVQLSAVNLASAIPTSQDARCAIRYSFAITDPLLVYDDGSVVGSSRDRTHFVFFKRSFQPCLASKPAPRSLTRENPPAGVRFKRSPNQHIHARPYPTHSRKRDAPTRRNSRCLARLRFVEPAAILWRGFRDGLTLVGAV
jgi:hypothetical protein